MLVGLQPQSENNTNKQGITCQLVAAVCLIVFPLEQSLYPNTVNDIEFPILFVLKKS